MMQVLTGTTKQLSSDTEGGTENMDASKQDKRK